jgi:hypothetical protein
MQGAVDEAEEEAAMAISPEFICSHWEEVQLGKMPRDRKK